MECSICGISEKNRLIFSAISPKGIIIVCEKCAAEEGYPRVNKPKPEEDKTKGESVYKRMTRISGVTPRTPEPERLRTQERTIKEIINKNYEEKVKRENLRLKPRPDLTENFHWILMRVRRVKGLTQKQLAERIGESEAAIKMAEQGVVPEGYNLIEKLEQFFKVKLIKDRETIVQNPPQIQTQQQGKVQIITESLKFDKKTLDALTISDLQRLKLERETKNKEMDNSKKEEENSTKKENN